ncbi:hypothetical protein NCCP2140_24380 [Pseudoalteromonas sp. NCCP-2140]|uniref:hypothetical protein n=1 Tax=Pseudoalteromonas sp. NCCP-2140 TaxID=2942288 RepID=UPI00203A782F|nr:hypothetical protein [Pseudoalteromonas sp. NCCP-2140]GKW53385.1 hypothetical protein NCCP2140_24380 [Pseudoalteromonas sp. NCCP-2140]
MPKKTVHRKLNRHGCVLLYGQRFQSEEAKQLYLQNYNNLNVGAAVDVKIEYNENNLSQINIVNIGGGSESTTILVPNVSSVLNAPEYTKR